MSDAVKKEFEYRRGNLMLFPYSPMPGPYGEEALIALYKRLKDEGLWEVVFHENTAMTLLEFMNFFSGPFNLLQILALVSGDSVLGMAGMAWLTDIQSCDGIMTRGVASIVYFKDYQKPMYTDQFADMILGYWFDVLGIDTVIGMTPESNRPTVMYSKRVGFKEIGRIPQYTTINKKVEAGVMLAMTKDDYRQMVGG